MEDLIRNIENAMCMIEYSYKTLISTSVLTTITVNSNSTIEDLKAWADKQEELDRLINMVISVVGTQMDKINESIDYFYNNKSKPFMVECKLLNKTA